ncbi:hypothetical protein JYK00_06025 [Thermosipho ferrireducens]|uniref:Mur ligase central domain-containing protein n=1 Tax=Thermosipho ferrireducens TaxID=2571116 RepID=A0ABX7S617_9BACT|nr:hypothetical protein [Thermosipho ferrireducens]QTA37298.1 hypothetical protein JYK00_06025 [Thermosipho ferrireducens]
MLASILKHNVISIVGLAKNTGKTETFNFLLKYLSCKGIKLGITSIGIDGEEKDQVTYTPKPNIYIQKNIFFATTEKFYRQKSFLSEIFHVTSRTTATGRIVVAKALEKGKIILAGPTTKNWLNEIVNTLFSFKCEKILIDGALSRLTSASPLISEAVVLATGASLSLNEDEIIKKTLHLLHLMSLPVTEHFNLLKDLSEGVWGLGEKTIKLAESALRFEPTSLIENFKIIYVSGILTNNFITKLMKTKNVKEVVIEDFTRIFCSREKILNFESHGKTIKVLKKPNVVMITINPVSPYGYKIDDNYVISKLKEKTSIPIINVRKVDPECQN